MVKEEFNENLYKVGIICERLPFTKPDPINPDGYADHLSGDWKDVPAWAIRRINFLENQMAFNDRARCPQGGEMCPDIRDEDLSCHIVKHCYPYLCKGSCGHNEVWVSDDEKEVLNKYRKEKYG